MAYGLFDYDEEYDRAEYDIDSFIYADDEELEDIDWDNVDSIDDINDEIWRDHLREIGF